MCAIVLNPSLQDPENEATVCMQWQVKPTSTYAKYHCSNLVRMIVCDHSGLPAHVIHSLNNCVRLIINYANSQMDHYAPLESCMLI